MEVNFPKVLIIAARSPSLMRLRIGVSTSPLVEDEEAALQPPLMSSVRLKVIVMAFNLLGEARGNILMRKSQHDARVIE